jgi:predicted dehydrogenase
MQKEIAMDSIGMGVIGVGRMGALFARLLAQLPQAELLGVADVEPERAQALAEAAGTAPFTDYRELLALDGLQAVVIATPDQLHHAPVMAALEMGKPVLVEKPLTMDVMEGEELVATAEEAGLCLMVAHCLRFDPSYIQARNAVREGAIGEIVNCYARRNIYFDEGRRIAQRTSLPFYLGVHDIDILQWITGNRVVRLRAYGSRRLMEDLGMDDAVQSLLEFDDGSIGCVEQAWVFPRNSGPRRSPAMEIVGTAGFIHVDPYKTGVSIHQAGEASYPDTAYIFDPIVHGRVVGVYEAETAHFLECVATRQEPIITAREALEAVRVAVAIERSLAEDADIAL